ncbi:Protein priB, partial [Pseudocercospora fuligena]
MKCHLIPNSEKCERCVRKALDCTFQQHRRGRKLGMRLSTSQSAKRATGERPSSGEPGQAVHWNGANAGTPDIKDNVSTPSQMQQLPPVRSWYAEADEKPPKVEGNEEGINESDSREQSDSDRPYGFWADPDGFNPPSLLNRHASQGNFSLQNILSTNTEAPKRPTSGEISTSAPRSPGDPVTKGIINMAIAESLFEGFMKNLNPYVSQLDPTLHTFQYVRVKSSFLLTAVLAAAAKLLNPSVFSPLRDHAERLYMEVFRRGLKSPEVVHGIMLLTYWKEPDDTRAFVNVGIAIRICHALGWHKLKAQDLTVMSEGRAREIRSMERTWLVLFVYDRSISMQTGKPCMIERSRFIESIDDWLKSPFGETDGLLAAFTHLRLLTSELPGLLNPADNTSSQPSSRPLLRLLKEQIGVWRKRWTQATTREPRHQFLVQYYADHTLLMLYSGPLQASLSSKTGPLDLEPFWVSYNAATGILRLVSSREVAGYVYFVQDSMHVMLAYASVFLIKVCFFRAWQECRFLLLSIPRAVRAEVESTILETLSTARDAFALQSAPANTGCALQAMFLANVVSKVEKLCQRRQSRSAQKAADTPSHMQTSQPMAVDGSGQAGAASTSMEAIAMQYGSVSQATAADDALSGPSITPESQNYNFFDDEMWSSMFASAGFSINDGIFLPDFNG